MISITGLEAIPAQRWQTPIDTGTIFFSLRYRPAAQMWFIDIRYNSFEVKGLRVNKNVNILNQFCNIIPFGLYCEDRKGAYEPILIDDFSSGRFRFNILDQSELDSIDNQRKAAKL
jgi:hypothetical protein